MAGAMRAPVRRSGIRHGAARIAVVLELLVGAAAVYGGIGLIVDRIGMDPAWLRDTPFTSWTVPGVLLLLFVAAPMLVAAAAGILRSRSIVPLSLTAGCLLVAWVIGQWLIIGRYFFLQPAMLAAGVLVLLLAWCSPRGKTRRAR